MGLWITSPRRSGCRLTQDTNLRANPWTSAGSASTRLVMGEIASKAPFANGAPTRRATAEVETTVNGSIRSCPMLPVGTDRRRRRLWRGRTPPRRFRTDVRRVEPFHVADPGLGGAANAGHTGRLSVPSGEKMELRNSRSVKGDRAVGPVWRRNQPL